MPIIRHVQRADCLLCSTACTCGSFAEPNGKRSGDVLVRHLDLVFNRRVLLAMYFSPRGYPVVNLNPIPISPSPVWYCRVLTWFSVGLFFFLSKSPGVDSLRGVSITPFLCVERKGLRERVREGRTTDQQTKGWVGGGVEMFSNHADPLCPDIVFLCAYFPGHTLVCLEDVRNFHSKSCF